MRAEQPPPVSPALLRHFEERSKRRENRVADRITRFAGSMLFVYVHIVVFAVWMLVLEKNPWPSLTLTVSLEAIFLSTFVMIGQNRAAAFQQAKADHDFVTSENELHANSEMLQMIHTLTVQLHKEICLKPPAAGTPGGEGKS